MLTLEKISLLDCQLCRNRKVLNLIGRETDDYCPKSIGKFLFVDLLKFVAGHDLYEIVAVEVSSLGSKPSPTCCQTFH